MFEGAPYPDYEFIVNAVSSRFLRKEHYLRNDGSIEFRLYKSPNIKKNFEDLIFILKPRGFIALLREGEDDELVLLVLRSIHKPVFKSRLALILFLATMGTVALDGFLRFSNFPFFSSFEMVLYYTLAIIGIIGVHELGHKVASSLHKMRSSLPYFIPGIPGLWPTWGAVITAGEPPINKDSLFDLGIAGPVSGLIATIIVAIGGAITSPALPAEVISEQVAAGNLRLVSRMDWFTTYILDTFAKAPEGMGLVLSPLIFASSIGFLITFLNLMPAWQLDGGHIASSALDATKHKILTYVSIALLFLLGFYLMAFLILLLSGRAPQMRPLDDVSSLSKGRKVAFVLILILAGMLWYFTIRDNPYFFPSQNLT
jgi:hypothetical protein